MTESTDVALDVVYGKLTKRVSLPQHSTVADVRNLMQLFDLQDVQDVTLISKGKKLADDALLDSVTKIMVLKTPKAEQERLVSNEMKMKDKLAAREKYAASAYVPIKRISTLEDAEEQYVFHGIDILPQFLHRRNDATALLQRIRNDEGIKHVMKLHKFTVGRLIELSPAEESILGYNRNKGELIALRLRTSDLEGFRPYDMVLKVCLHELTHNVHSDHNNDFHTLCSQLNKEYHAFWEQRRGGEHRLNDAIARTAHYDEAEEDLTDTHGYQGGTFILGPREQPKTHEELREARTRALQKDKK
jgi:hypothetical protein